MRAGWFYRSWVPVVLLVLGSTPSWARPARNEGYRQSNLVADTAGAAARVDSHLVNAWGLAVLPQGLVWVSDNGTGVSTAYHLDGRPFPSERNPLVVTVPPSPGSTEGGKPTGLVLNHGRDFVVSKGAASGPSLIIFAGEDGSLSGWNPRVDAATAIVGASRPAVYKGIEIARGEEGSLLFATDFHGGAVDVFDSSFTFLRSFSDATVPTGFAPFGIRAIRGQLFVTFAKQKPPENEDDEAGPGNGFVEVFDVEGKLVRRFASQGTLNSPWGLALAPRGFGKFSGALLVGNFGDGRINGFELKSGNFLGQLDDPDGNPISIDGLWGLTFRQGHGPRQGAELFFTAGPDDESHGLLGVLTPAAPEHRR
jgi:uncharacterized protein (TIGR03118 family)